MNRAQPSARPCVLIYGSFQPPETPCGVTSAMKTLVSSPLASRYDLDVISTYRSTSDRNLAKRLLFGAFLFLKSGLQMLSHRAAVVDVFAVSGRDFLKHASIVLAARLMRRPCVLRIHGGDFDRSYMAESPMIRSVIRFCLRLSTRVVTLSSGWSERVRSIEPRIDTEVIPNSVDCEEGERIASMRFETPNRVLLLGNLCERKGHFDAIEAAARVRAEIPDVEFVFAGAERDPGTHRALLVRLEERSLRDAVSLPGPIFGDDKRRLLQDSRILILPSHTENMPLSIMEGMACGLPIVATRVGAIPEMIDDGENGFLIDPRDVDTLAKRILDLLRDPALCRKIGESAMRHARLAWDQSVIARRTLDLYDTLASPRTETRGAIW